MTVRFVSLFSGVGGLDLGAEAGGWECVAQVEWDAECQAVLARHWPNVPRWGDVTTVHGAELPPADVITFGSPCQDLSVAGNRAGMVEGSRSNLFFDAVRIIREMREATDGRYPRFAVWENVAGALSSNAGRDFGAVLDALAEAGALDIAWRILDARWTGVPQRRRRVFVVADFAGERAGDVLADTASLCGDLEPCGSPRSDGAAGSRSGAASGGFVGCLTGGGRLDDNEVGGGQLIAEFVNALDTMRGGQTTTRRKQVTSSSTAACLNSGGNKGGFRTEPGEHLVIEHE